MLNLGLEIPYVLGFLTSYPSYFVDLKTLVKEQSESNGEVCACLKRRLLRYLQFLAQLTK